MAKLFIYFSISGNGDVVAEKLKNADYEIRKIETKKKFKNNFFGIFSGGFLAGINSKAKLVNYDNNVSNYDEIIIGSPIWNSKFSTPINTVLRDTNLENKNLTFVLYSGSGTAKKAEKRINKEYPNAKILILKEPKRHEEEIKKLEEFIYEKR